MTDSPDLIQPVIGFRAWKLRSDSTLHSGGAGDTSWLPGANHATCRAEEIRTRQLAQVVASGVPSPTVHPLNQHEAPAAACRCGLYCFHGIPVELLQWSRVGLVVGAVVVWGNLEVHRTGIRAEFARVIAIGLPDVAAAQEEVRQEHERVAARYSASLVPVVDLEREAQRHGIKVPEEMLPEEERIEVDFAVAAQPMAIMLNGFKVATTAGSLHIHTAHLATGGFLSPAVQEKPPRSRFNKFVIAWDFSAAAINLGLFIFAGWGWWNLVACLVLVALGAWVLRKR